MAKIKLRLAARCEAAGRLNNEDNYLISENLSEGKWGFTTDKEIELSELGTLLIVADGMGGMNAGEVASALAINTIQEWFSPENLSKESFSYPENIKTYIRKAIQAADRIIKNKGNGDDKSMSGMGSTIVLAWIINKYVYVGWCGDSRAYRFNPADGLHRLSHDHSYVQELVDNGKLDEKLAFDFPERNIITRSLGDPRGKANPDVIEFPLRNGDLFLLCSDGLSGVLRDKEIEKVVTGKTNSLEACRDALWETSRNAEWDDNVTLVLCQVLSGVETEKASSTVKLNEPEIPETPDTSEQIQPEKQGKQPEKKKKNRIWLWIIIVLSAVIGYILLNKPKKTSPSDNIFVTDSVETTVTQVVTKAVQEMKTDTAPPVYEEATSITPVVKEPEPASADSINIHAGDTIKIPIHKQ